MRIRVPLALVAITLVALGGLAAGCSDDSAPRSELQVTQINDNQPLASDVAEGPDSSITVREDVISIRVSNTPHDEVLDLSPGNPFSFVMLERYEITFEGPESIPMVAGGLGWLVESDRSVEGSLVVVPASHKVQAPLVSLRRGRDSDHRASHPVRPRGDVGHHGESQRVVLGELRQLGGEVIGPSHSRARGEPGWGHALWCAEISDATRSPQQQDQ